MTRHGPSIDDIKARANQERLAIIYALGIKERPNQSGLLLISDPRAKDKTPSFAIWTKAGTLTFKRYGAGVSGDVVDFVSYMRGWYDLPKKGRGLALRWLIDYLRLETVDPTQLARDAARSRERVKLEQKEAGEKLARDQEAARRWFIDAKPLLGSRADTYLNSRGIDLQDLPKGPRGGLRVPHALRALDRCKHLWEERGSPKNGAVSWWPAMLACCTDTDTTGILAVHRTWLAHNGVGKAGVEPDRKTWPSAKGLVIPLWRGESNMSVREAAAAGLRETFVLTEGIEDGLSAVLAKPQYRTWAYVYVDNLAAIVLPECCDGVIAHRQNELHNAAATRAFDRGVANLRRQGRPVVEVAALTGKDLNDTLRGAA